MTRRQFVTLTKALAITDIAILQRASSRNNISIFIFIFLLSF